MTRSSRWRLHSSNLVAASGVLLALMPGGGCSDPVRDAEIEALGGEDPDVPPGETHRPGQPCVHCHTKGGPASDSPFAVAGTIYETPDPDSAPAEGIIVQFVDARGGGPRVLPVTNEAGNFFVRAEDWPDITFPLKVALYDDETKPPIQKMKSLIGREPSCNYCHIPNLPPDDLTDEDVENNRRFVGQIYVRVGGS
mgnify:CR=1 FL=1